MSLEKNQVVTVSYELTVNGEVVDKGDEQKPLAFIYGVGMMIPGFESNLEPKSQGDEYAFDVDPAEGYGELNPEAVADIPISAFMVDGKVIEQLVVGETLPMQDQQGNPLMGKVMEIGEQSAKLDFNHPLAGQTLHFSGKVLEVREATKEELEHGHVHGPGGQQH